MPRSFLLLALFATAVVAHKDDLHLDDRISMTDSVVSFLLLLSLGVIIFAVCSTSCTCLDGPPRDHCDVIKVQIVEGDVRGRRGSPRDRI